MVGVGNIIIVCVLCLPYLGMVCFLRDKKGADYDENREKAVFQGALREAI